MKELIQQEIIGKKIFLIRGQRVMLDKDFAILYDVQARYLNKAVRRNSDRFPEDFMFQLTKVEFEILMFQFGTSRWGGTRKLPYAFRERGVAMLSKQQVEQYYRHDKTTIIDPLRTDRAFDFVPSWTKSNA